MVPRVLECILLPSHQVRNWRDIQRKLGIGAGGKEVEVGTTEEGIILWEKPGRDD